VQPTLSRFGPFVIDRTGYRVLRGDAVVELTPKLLDLLLHLVDHPGELVTKEALLDTLWPGANVTDNALAQAISELRQALGDDAATSRYIKTVARRGYRFVAAVSAVSTASVLTDDSAPSLPGSSPQSIAVLDFTNMTGDPGSVWLGAGIAETVTGDLQALGAFRVIDRGRVMEAVRRTNGSFEAVSADLKVALVVVGSYQSHGERIRITARIVNVARGEALADAKIDGELAGIFELQDGVVEQLAKDLGIGMPTGFAHGGRQETPSLKAYRAYTEGWLQLESLDIGEIPKAIANFEAAIGIDARYALAYTGLASAELAAYESTRADSRPSTGVLTDAVAHARQAVALDDSAAEAHATLALVLASAGRMAEAVEAARRAVKLEPSNWRHFFRLGHASWGSERLQAAAGTLALYPDFAFSHFQTAMVHVARGRLHDAEIVLRQGAAVQDRQISRGDRYPALGLHWLLGLVRLAQDDVDEALRELDRERVLAEPHRLYGREFQRDALHARGACFLRMGRIDSAIDCFNEALASYPDDAGSQVGLMLSARAAGKRSRAESMRKTIDGTVRTLESAQPVKAAIIKGQLLVIDGRGVDACAALCSLLEAETPGHAAWSLPVEPFFVEPIRAQIFAPVLAKLADRAR
jgi:DNA-binding winged helix-turn-helix (wHTH) protein/tetratricopeptide (TPR) repeat protein